MTSEKKNPPTMTNAQGQLLVRLARQTIAEKLGQPFSPQETRALEEALLDDVFQAACGTFVTLTIGGNLRGCIGALTGCEPLEKGVRQNALNAAFRDPRFRPLRLEEFHNVRIEVSVLTDPKPLDYTDGNDLAARLRPNIDGVIIRKGIASATFLPQVWEQLPRPKDFLGNLCLKAGLSSSEWQKGKMDVSTYQVQYFEEVSEEAV